MQSGRLSKQKRIGIEQLQKGTDQIRYSITQVALLLSVHSLMPLGSCRWRRQCKRTWNERRHDVKSWRKKTQPRRLKLPRSKLSKWLLLRVILWSRPCRARYPGIFVKDNELLFSAMLIPTPPWLSRWTICYKKWAVFKRTKQQSSQSIENWNLDMVSLISDPPIRQVPNKHSHHVWNIEALHASYQMTKRQMKELESSSEDYKALAWLKESNNKLRQDLIQVSVFYGISMALGFMVTNPPKQDLQRFS